MMVKTLVIYWQGKCKIIGHVFVLCEKMASSNLQPILNNGLISSSKVSISIYMGKLNLGIHTLSLKIALTNLRKTFIDKREEKKKV